MRRTSPKRTRFYKTATYEGIVGRIATNVRKIREEKGWTQADLAFRADEMEVVVLQGIERGSTNLTAVTLARLCDALGVDVQALMEPAAPPEKRPRGRPKRSVIPKPKSAAK